MEMRSGAMRRSQYWGWARTVAIVGGGASGVLTALHLLRQTTAPLKIVFIEPRPNLGGGIAYSTTCDAHLLNVRAGNMSAFADDADHFIRWLRKNAREDCSAHSFVRRSLYGDYLGDTLFEYEGRARALASVDHYRAPATGIETIGDLVRISLGNDLAIVADRVVLALGHQTRRHPLRFSHDVEIASAWSKSAFDALDPADPVLLLGTGLTAVDAALALDARGHRGMINAISRHGNWPREQTNVRARDGFAPHRCTSARASLRSIREHVRLGGDWQAAIDGLRPYSDQIWASWATDEKRRFFASPAPLLGNPSAPHADPGRGENR